METGEMKDDKGNVYKTIKLADGNWWTGQNWRYDVDSEIYDSGCTLYHTAGGMTDPSTLSTLGLYYNYEILATTIPDGWHIPTEAEWNKLIAVYGQGNEVQALHALAKGGSSGLDLEIGGWCVPGGTNCSYYDINGNYWSQTDGERNIKKVLTLDMEHNKVHITDWLIDRCLSARLIKDKPIPKPHRGRGPKRRF